MDTPLHTQKAQQTHPAYAEITILPTQNVQDSVNFADPIGTDNRFSQKRIAYVL